MIPSLNGRRCQIVMDNASFHHGKAVETTICAGRSSVNFLPLYSLQQKYRGVFGLLQRQYPQVTPRPQNTQQLIDVVENLLVEYRHYNFQIFYW